MAGADAAFSRMIRDRDESCRAAGTDSIACAGHLQCAHLVSRRYRALRWSEQGATALCQAHHVYFTHHPLEWMAWVTRYTPTGLTWDELVYLALNDPPEKPTEALARMRGAA
jgi:hypothetical protein